MNDRLEAQFENLLVAVWADLQRPGVVWQIAMLAGCVVLAWALSRLVLRRTPGAATAKWQFGAEGLKRCLFPLFALVLVVVAREGLRPHLHVSLLDLAVPLAGSAALIRILVYTLRYVFAPSGVLAAFERAIALVSVGRVRAVPRRRAAGILFPQREVRILSAGEPDKLPPAPAAG